MIGEFIEGTRVESIIDPGGNLSPADGTGIRQTSLQINTDTDTH